MPSTHNISCTPLVLLLAACRVDYWLRSISHADRIPKSHAARSISHHRRFVTRVTILRSSSSYRFSSRFLHPAPLQLLHWQQRKCGRLTAHSLVALSSLHSPQSNRNSTTKLVTTLPSTIFLQRQSPLSSSLFNARTAPPGAESASFSVETWHPHPLHRLASVCNSASFSSFCRCTNLCLGLLDPSPRSLGLSSSPGSGRCSPARYPAWRRATCPHVGHGPQPTLDAARERLRQGDVGGGAGGKLSLTSLRNQMMRSGEPPRMGPPLEAWQARDKRLVGTIFQCKG